MNPRYYHHMGTKTLTTIDGIVLFMFCVLSLGAIIGLLILR